MEAPILHYRVVLVTVAILAWSSQSKLVLRSLSDNVSVRDFRSAGTVGGKYGNNITYIELFNLNRLWTVDTRALNHILTHSTDFQKTTITRRMITQFVGAGILATEGEQHRQQRRVMNPAFGPAQIRELTPIFINKAIQLRDIWLSEISQNNGCKRIDILNWLSRVTLDIIGLAGFDYEFRNLETGQLNELSEAFKVIFNGNSRARIITLLREFIPILSIIPTEHSRRVGEAKRVMHRIDIVKCRDLEGRDLLTLLLKANMATDIPANQKLSEEDVLAQIPTFLVAGHETTSTAVTWCLYALTQAPEVQQKLREELLSVPTETPTIDELNSLSYLEIVVRETLRLYAPVPTIVRQAMKDDVIPVGEPYTDRFGEVRDEIRIRKGDVIMVPILAMNRSTKLWGSDAHQFKPERWEKPPECVTNIPGVWGHLMTFLGGPRACIGYRFSLVEMKAILFTFVRAFEFEHAVQPESIIRKNTSIPRPYVSTEPEKGDQMPLLVKPYRVS
ncbi:unnamed protein product [Somion occarium]|uniref:Cytochrome P450 n=1 Tax=Somion occarium TaxID=3059160 RepID=A0ABP1DNW4_9APHY